MTQELCFSFVDTKSIFDWTTLLSNLVGLEVTTSDLAVFLSVAGRILESARREISVTGRTIVSEGTDEALVNASRLLDL